MGGAVVCEEDDVMLKFPSIQSVQPCHEDQPPLMVVGFYCCHLKSVENVVATGYSQGLQSWKSMENNLVMENGQKIVMEIEN